MRRPWPFLVHESLEEFAPFLVRPQGLLRPRPQLAQRLRGEIAGLVGPEHAELAERLRELRPWAKETFSTYEERREFFQRVVDEEWPRATHASPLRGPSPSVGARFASPAGAPQQEPPG